MTSIESRLRPVWQQWHGVIPVWAARNAGVRPEHLRRWAGANPDVDNVGYGVYAWYPDDGDDVLSDWRLTRFATALAQAGPKARLCDTSVLEAARIGTIGGGDIRIEVPTRRRAKDGVSYAVRNVGAETRAIATVAGLLAQPIADALRDSRSRLDDDKYEEALSDAAGRGLISQSQYRSLAMEGA